MKTSLDGDGCYGGGGGGGGSGGPRRASKVGLFASQVAFLQYHSHGRRGTGCRQR